MTKLARGLQSGLCTWPAYGQYWRLNMLSNNMPVASALPQNLSNNTLDYLEFVDLTIKRVFVITHSSLLGPACRQINRIQGLLYGLLVQKASQTLVGIKHVVDAAPVWFLITLGISGRCQSFGYQSATTDFVDFEMLSGCKRSFYKLQGCLMHACHTDAHYFMDLVWIK
jgi:hypothetical protein